MTPERWRLVEPLFNEIADLPIEEHAARLAAIDDPDLRDEVALLLRSASLSEGIGEAVAAAVVSEFAERRFGPWRVTGTLGFGGMGAVYKAVRDDSAFDKQVALKVLPAGLETPQAVERFRQERSILAALEHPNIARLIDGGESEGGQSYIAMEFVDGIEITRFATSLSRREILELFLRVCSAVQYAHRALVVHRDLKPANILVSADGEPKLLDLPPAQLQEPVALLREAEDLLVKVTTDEPTRLNGFRILALSRFYLGQHLSAVAQPAAAIPFYRSAIAVAGKMFAKGPGDLSLTRTALRAEQALAETLARQGEKALALEHAQRALARATAIPASASQKDRVAAYLAEAHHTLAAEESLKSWRALQTSSSPAASPKDAAKAEEILRLANRQLR